MRMSSNIGNIRAPRVVKPPLNDYRPRDFYVFIGVRTPPAKMERRESIGNGRSITYRRPYSYDAGTSTRFEALRRAAGGITARALVGGLTVSDNIRAERFDSRTLFGLLKPR